MELIKLLQIEGVSEATQEDIILNFLECIDEESAFSIIEEYEQAEMSLTESIINEVSLGYALKKSLGGAVQRFKDIRKKQADVSTDRPIGLAGIRKQEAQKQDVAKSQERFKQAKATAKDIVNRMLSTRYVRDNKGVTKAPDVKAQATQATKVAEPAKATKVTQAPKTQTVKTIKVTKAKAPKVKTQTTKAEAPKAKVTKATKAPEVKVEVPKTQTVKATKVTKAKTTKAPEVNADNAKVAEVAKKTIAKAKEELKQEQPKAEAKKEEKQPVVAGAKKESQASTNIEKLQKQLERLSNLPYSDKVAAKMDEIEKQLK